MWPDQRLDFQRLKRCVSIEQVLGHFGLLQHLRPRGDKLVGVCPLHRGADNPNAFVVDLQWQRWHCFTRCGRGGDVVEFVRALCGLSYSQTAEFLARLAEGERRGLGAAPSPGVRVGPPAGRRPLEFRPFTRRLHLRTEHPFFGRLGLGGDTLQRFQAGHYPLDQGFLAGCVAVRLHDLQGRALGYAGRRLDQRAIDAFGKWKMPPGLPKGRMLYNWHRAKNFLPGPLIVTEGPWAVMKLWQAGFPSAVALLGRQLSEAQEHLLRSGGSPVILLLDGDPPGMQAAARIARRLDPAPLVVRPGAGVDPDELDELTLRELIGAALGRAGPRAGGATDGRYQGATGQTTGNGEVGS